MVQKNSGYGGSIMIEKEERRKEIENYKYDAFKSEFTYEEFLQWKESMHLINDIHELSEKLDKHGSKFIIAYELNNKYKDGFATVNSSKRLTANDIAWISEIMELVNLKERDDN